MIVLDKDLINLVNKANNGTLSNKEQQWIKEQKQRNTIMMGTASQGPQYIPITIASSRTVEVISDIMHKYRQRMLREIAERQQTIDKQNRELIAEMEQRSNIIEQHMDETLERMEQRFANIGSVGIVRTLI